MNKKTQNKRGFSLTEVLLAVGTLAVGMLFIAGVFPVSIHFTAVASERTIAATVADEAFAKIKLYGIYDPNLSDISQNLYENVSGLPIPYFEFGYPSTTDDLSQKYWWSAICRRVGTDDVQVTVFISRKAGAVVSYPNLINTGRPVAVEVSYTAVLPADELTIPAANKTLVNDGCTIVDDDTGRICRVLERYKSPDNVIHLDKLWQGNSSGSIWVVPPPVGGGRYPCIAVFQKVMRF